MAAPPPSASEAPDPALIDRFRRDLGAALGREPELPVALAVSGGPDSMAMLALAAAAFPGGIVAATYDHRARAGSAAEAAAVGRACAGLGVPHSVLAPPLATPVFRHAEARALRYAALERWAVEAGARVLLTAHHADDQAETLLMRLNRGSGLAGLAGVRSRREVEGGALTIVRPLLGWRRAELRAVAAASELPFVDDPANADPRFARAGVRAFLAAQHWLDPAALARAARHLGEAEADLAAAERWLWRTRRVVPTGVDDRNAQCWIDVADLPRELRRRLARAAVAEVRLRNGMLPDFDPATNVEPLLDALNAGRAATQAEVMATPVGTVWRFRKAPPRRVR